MPVEEEDPATLRKGVQVVDPWSGTVVTVKKVRKDGDIVVLEIGKAFCTELRFEKGKLAQVWRRTSRRKVRKEDGE